MVSDYLQENMHAQNITCFVDTWHKFAVLERSAEAVLSQNAGWFLRLSQAKPNSQQRSAKGGVYTSLAAQADELDDVAVNAALKWWNLQVVGATSDLASCIMEAMPSTLMADTKSGGFICIKTTVRHLLYECRVVFVIQHAACTAVMRVLSEDMDPSVWRRCSSDVQVSTVSSAKEKEQQLVYTQLAASYLLQQTTPADVLDSKLASLCKSSFGFAAIAAAFAIAMHVDVCVIRYPPSIDDGLGSFRFWSKGAAPRSAQEACKRTALTITVVDVGGGKFRSTTTSSQQQQLQQ